MLLSHDRSYQSQQKIIESIRQIRGAGVTKAVRVPGGITVTERDLEDLLDGHACTRRRSLRMRYRAYWGKPGPAPHPAAAAAAAAAAATGEGGGKGGGGSRLRRLSIGLQSTLLQVSAGSWGGLQVVALFTL